jgi:hypothetical protein
MERTTSYPYRHALLLLALCLLVLVSSHYLSLVGAGSGAAEAGGPERRGDSSATCEHGAPVIVYADDFESGKTTWINRGLWDTWTYQEWKSRSGRFAWYASAPAATSEKRLDSPDISLPSNAASLRLSFWHYRNLEADDSRCQDGGVLGLSTDGGNSWLQIQNRDLLVEPYDGHIPYGIGNPLGARDAWCGQAGEWREVLVNFDRYAGRTVRVRFHMGTDRTVASEGWYVDDVSVLACLATGQGHASTLLPLLHQDQALR